MRCRWVRGNECATRRRRADYAFAYFAATACVCYTQHSLVVLVHFDTLHNLSRQIYREYGQQLSIFFVLFCEHLGVSSLCDERVVLGAAHIEAGECHAFAGLQHIAVHVHYFAHFGGRQIPVRTYAHSLNVGVNSRDIQVDRHTRLSTFGVNQCRSCHNVGHCCATCVYMHACMSSPSAYPP